MKVTAGNKRIDVLFESGPAKGHKLILPLEDGSADNFLTALRGAREIAQASSNTGSLPEMWQKQP